jgi:hypothetical protein
LRNEQASGFHVRHLKIVQTGRSGVRVWRNVLNLKKRTLPAAKIKSSHTMIEILTLNLKPGIRDKFHQLYITLSLPLLKKWKIEVVAHGPSLHDENSYFVIRSFKSLEDRQKSEDAFYSSDDWQKGPRTTILALIENYATIVISAETFKGWSLTS